MKCISILGSGWLGLPLALKLKKSGHPVKVSSRSAERLAVIRQAGLEAYHYDIDNREPSVTAPLKTQSSTDNTNDSDFLAADILVINITSKNIESFENLIKNIELSSIQYVLFISSTSVYKNNSNLLLPDINEDNFASLIPCPLLEIETLFQRNSHFQTSIIRFSGLIGYQRHPGNFFLATNNDSIYCKTIKNPDARINMIHRDDCLSIIKKVIEKNCWGEVFNACASTHPLRRDFYRAALSHLGGYEPTFSGQAGSEGKVICNQKLKEKLNYSFIHDDISKFDLMPFNEK
jgi:nucleoside-diphosphate-sugar epimerase